MKTYSLTINMSQSQFVQFLEGAGPELQDMKLTVFESDAAEQIHALHPAPKKAAPARKSKVNEAITGALADGPKTAGSLKEALVAAGMSAGSLSTGLAALQKAKAITRGNDGAYALAA